MICKKAFLVSLMLATLAMPPLAYADVVTLETDMQVYDKSDRITFSGTEEDGRQMVTLIIRDPSGTMVNLKGDPSSDGDGYFEIIPIPIKNVFSVVGVYEAIAFTATQPVSNATGVNLHFDGIQVKVTEVYDLELKPIGDKVIDEGREYSFVAEISDDSITVEEYSLGRNSPEGAKIDPKTGKFTWMPTEAQGPGSYIMEIIVTAGVSEDRETITVTVNETQDDDPIAAKETPAAAADGPPEPEKMEPNPSETTTGEKGLASFVDPERDPQSYVDRYNGEKVYRDWFDANFPQYLSIYEAVGLPEPDIGICGEGTGLIDGICTITDAYKKIQPKPQTCFLLWCW